MYPPFGAQIFWKLTITWLMLYKMLAEWRKQSNAIINALHYSQPPTGIDQSQKYIHGMAYGPLYHHVKLSRCHILL
ncbi:hypothetical protein VNO78_34798 [Psophocarpus tetragonolobus]|uniref:Uncharacterized protein n=1 Tax=Psophocarpus tetragonolobus TaxID=3891 RepID=A0AAN9NP43_PSOTE